DGGRNIRNLWHLRWRARCRTARGHPLHPPLCPLRLRREEMSRHRHDRVVIAPGADTTCFDGVREITEPTLVGLDRRGRPRTFGSRATSLPAEEVVIPFGSVDVFHIDLAAAYLDWLIGGFHARIPVAAILTPIGAGDTFGRWQGLVERMSRHVVLLSRPMAAAVGLRLDVDSPGGSLVV